MSERYEVEKISPEGETRWTHREIDDAMVKFYGEVANDYSEPSVEVYLHDLVAGKTLIAHNYADRGGAEGFTKLNYDPMGEQEAVGPSLKA